MRHLLTGMNIAVACLWAVALFMSTIAMAEETPEVAALPITGGANSPFHTIPLDSRLTLNDNITPIEITEATHIRGFSLSGNAKLTKECGAGESSFAGTPTKWDAYYKMSTGCALLHCKTPIMIEACRGVAFVSAGTTFIAHVDNRTSRFVNLTDQHRRSVRIMFNKRYVDLEPGQELVLVETSKKDAREVAVQEDIAWKDLQYDVVDNVFAYVFRVSTADMMERCHIYRQLSQSPDPEDKRMKDQIFKTVAALEVMYNKKTGPFTIGKPYAHGDLSPAPQQEKVAGSKNNPV